MGVGNMWDHDASEGGRNGGTQEAVYSRNQQTFIVCVADDQSGRQGSSVR